MKDFKIYQSLLQPNSLQSNSLIHLSRAGFCVFKLNHIGCVLLSILLRIKRVIVEKCVAKKKIPIRMSQRYLLSIFDIFI